MSTVDVSTVGTTDNAALVRRGYGLQRGRPGDPHRARPRRRLLAHAGRSSIAGDRRGRDAVFGQFGRYAGETGGTFKATLQRVLTDEDGRVIGIHQNTAERNGKQLDVYCCIVFELKDGRLTDGREHFYDLHAWDEFWS